LTRPFDKHLDSDELDRLVSSQRTSVSDLRQLLEQSLRETRRHVESCPDCSQKLQMHKSVHSEILRMRAPNSSPLTPECIGDAEWLEVAAGLYPETKTRELMKHAAQCEHCGPLLKNAAEALVDETTPSEETWLASLPSTSQEWRKNMADILRSGSAARDASPEKQNKKEAAPWWQALFSGPRPAVAFAGIAVAVMAGWLGWRMLHSPSAEGLLAQAYTEHRTLELRLPGAKYAPMRVERGAGGSSLDKPPSLLKAEALIGEKLRSKPNDPAWLLARARADLLDGNYESAIKSLEQALETQPESPQLLTDLGSAYFLRAESAHHEADYGEAIEVLETVLHKDPRNMIALFNEAIILEKLSLFQRAIEDWDRYLAIDAQSAWAGEARANLVRVKQRMADREKRTSGSLLSPTAFSATFDSSHEDAAAVLDQRAEQYLEVAIQSWLPQADSYPGPSLLPSVEARHSLEYLAEILKNRHDDTWLTEFLLSPPSLIQEEGLRALLASDDALHGGRYSHSIILARKSMESFRRSQNQAGMIRASFALMLAQSFALKYSDCIGTAKLAIPLLDQTRYRWLQAQTLIQLGECQQGTAQLEEAITSASKGAELAKRFHYRGLELRATAFAAGYQLYTSSSDQGLRRLRDALTAFWESDVTSTRGENLYTVLSDIAAVRNWHHIEAFATAEILTDFPVKDPVDQAVELEFLAGAQERAGDYQAAQETLQSTAARLATLPEDSAVLLRKAEIALQNARIQLHLGDARAAVANLVGLRRQFETANPGLLQAEYFKTYGEASLALGDDATAKPLLDHALHVTETGLRSLRLEADKLEWSRTQSQIYRDLLELKLKSGTPAEAMAWWEWYKGASLRAKSTTDFLVSTDDGASSFAPPEVSSYAVPSNTALISYVYRKDSTTAFVFYDGNVHSHALQLPSDVDSLALRFLRRCTRPSTDVDSFDAESRRLYDLLVAPLEADTQGATALRFETDGISDQIPFDLLQGTDGHYLADRFEVTFSPGLAYGFHSTREALSPASSALIVVAAGAQEPELAMLPEATDEGNEVASYFHEARVISGHELTRTEVLRSLRNAQVFHFVGHAVAGINRVGLVLGSDAVLNSRDLVMLRPRKLRLAILSACDTANGAEGTFADVNSIARTLAVAGVPQVVASRWKIDSAVTHQLMRAFYSNLMSGRTPAESLHLATLAVRSLPAYQHPYYWGSFAVFGSY
jgi:CHAT domain-containing protein/tetratricopeptide (TPR) repeat protein